MTVLGWVTALGALWIVCAWGVAIVIGGVIVRSRADHEPLAPAVLVPRPRSPHRAVSRVACTSSRTVHRRPA